MTAPRESTDPDSDSDTDAGGTAEDITPYQDRPTDDGKVGQKVNRRDAPQAQSSLDNFAGEDLQPDHPVRER